MTGFGIFMTIVIYGFWEIVLATIVSVMLVRFAKKRLRRKLHGRRAFLIACGFAPFAGLLWFVAAFLIHVQISKFFMLRSRVSNVPNYIFIALILAGEAAIAFGLWKRWTTLQQRAAQI